MKTLFFFCLFIASLFIYPPNVSAHGFGQLYNLPVPFWMYLYGGAAAIVVSFIIVGYFLNKTTVGVTYPKALLKNTSSLIASKSFILILKGISLFLFFLTVVSGFVGTGFAQENFNMTFFWIIFLLGLTYIIAILGNVWKYINPLAILVDIIEKLFRIELNGTITYPRHLSYFIALLFYFNLIWFELFYETTPYVLSLLIIHYTIISLSGVFLIGKRDWFEYGDFLNVFFRLIGRIAPFELVNQKLYFRPPFIGSIRDEAKNISLVLFILFILSSTAFDGFHSTILYYQYFLYSPLIPSNEIAYFFVNTFSLLFSLIIFFVIYMVSMFLVKKITQSKLTVNDLALKFAFTLIPIAFVYNVAHYFTLILIQGQSIIPILSDPFGYGWNLFGTAEYVTNLSVLNMNIIWHAQVALILLGHIVGVYLAHVVALDTFSSHKKALVSQIPMLILMVAFTMIGLWILALPINS
jgi:hypothetical protein